MLNLKATPALLAPTAAYVGICILASLAVWLLAGGLMTFVLVPALIVWGFGDGVLEYVWSTEAYEVAFSVVLFTAKLRRPEAYRRLKEIMGEQDE